MAVNDVVSGISASGTILTYQPAAGVECVITSVRRAGQAVSMGITNGTLTSVDTVAANVNLQNLKIFINNTNYLYLAAATSNYTSYSGLQTK